MTRHFLDVDDLSREALGRTLDRATDMKRARMRSKPHERLRNRTLGMLFEKPSTRTRVSFETGMTQLGGHALFLGEDDLQLGHGEPVRDTARALSGYVDAVMARVFDHDELAGLAEHATVPVINGLSDRAHPAQTLADLLTVRELFDGFDATVAWVGDGNNVASSFAVGAAMVGLDLRVATPPGHGLAPHVLERAEALGAAPALFDDPREAVGGADVVYTDVWVSMGEEDERTAKERAFREGGFQVNQDLLRHAEPNVRVMHCLPAERGNEVTDAVLEGERSVVWQQAENRLHAQKGLLVELVE